MTARLKLLIVDDDKGDRKLIREAIKNAGVDVDIDEADNGGEGVQKTSALRPNVVVILDTIMPGMDGFVTCKKIKEVDANVKVIICTGVVDAVDAGRAQTAGADDYCVKTEDYEALINAVKNLVTA